ncbi:hypothetical protein B0H63DRAFT_188490 [Podospora didyma]|uniref:Uncharacterized protein n=1 Tax=Podospora didyma TaxID=330526 RepID=A0AAE0NQZ6_9PEZI|nr:hypothetical protein B0H63DRAFT_188490 [Podospora didyma]
MCLPVSRQSNATARPRVLCWWHRHFQLRYLQVGPHLGALALTRSILFFATNSNPGWRPHHLLETRLLGRFPQLLAERRLGFGKKKFGRCGTAQPSFGSRQTIKIVLQWVCRSNPNEGIVRSGSQSLLSLVATGFGALVVLAMGGYTGIFSRITDLGLTACRVVLVL